MDNLLRSFYEGDAKCINTVDGKLYLYEHEGSGDLGLMTEEERANYEKCRDGGWCNSWLPADGELKDLTLPGEQPIAYLFLKRSYDAWHGFIVGHSGLRPLSAMMRAKLIEWDDDENYLVWMGDHSHIPEEDYKDFTLYKESDSKEDEDEPEDDDEIIDWG